MVHKGTSVTAEELELWTLWNLTFSGDFWNHVLCEWNWYLGINNTSFCIYCLLLILMPKEENSTSISMAATEAVKFNVSFVE